jgi:hypothetical protein
VLKYMFLHEQTLLIWINPTIVIVHVMEFVLFLFQMNMNVMKIC